MSAVDRLLNRATSTIKHTVVAPKKAGPQKPGRVFATSSVKVTPPKPVLGSTKVVTKKFDVLAHLEAKKNEGKPIVNKVGFSEDELNQLRAEYAEYVKNLMATMGDEPLFYTPPEVTETVEEPKAEVPAEVASEPESVVQAEPMVQGISVGDEMPVDTVIVTKKSRKKKTIDAE